MRLKDEDETPQARRERYKMKAMAAEMCAGTEETPVIK
jgi:hypothetical protein